MVDSSIVFVFFFFSFHFHLFFVSFKKLNLQWSKSCETYPTDLYFFYTLFASFLSCSHRCITTPLDCLWHAFCAQFVTILLLLVVRVPSSLMKQPVWRFYFIAFRIWMTELAREWERVRKRKSFSIYFIFFRLAASNKMANSNHDILYELFLRFDFIHTKTFIEKV